MDYWVPRHAQQAEFVPNACRSPLRQILVDLAVAGAADGVAPVVPDNRHHPAEPELGESAGAAARYDAGRRRGEIVAPTSTVETGGACSRNHAGVGLGAHRLPDAP